MAKTVHTLVARQVRKESFHYSQLRMEASIASIINVFLHLSILLSIANSFPDNFINISNCGLSILGFPG